MLVLTWTLPISLFDCSKVYLLHTLFKSILEILLLNINFFLLLIFVTVFILFTGITWI